MNMADYAVFGHPADHSLSPQLHGLFGHQKSLTINYSKHTIALDSFEQQVNLFFAQGGKGLNITSPFKERAFAMCAVTSERAAIAQAVNTLWLTDGKLHGDNTDGIGLQTDLTQRLGWQLVGKRLLILGAGGSVHGILNNLLQLRPQQCVIANRTEERAQQLVKQFRNNHSSVELIACGFEQLIGSFEYIINATSLSLGNDSIPFSPSIIDNQSTCYDLAYSSSGTTLFSRWAQQHGCRHSSDGLGMLVEQGAESFTIWTGVHPDTTGLIEQLRSALQSISISTTAAD